MASRVSPWSGDFQTRADLDGAGRGDKGSARRDGEGHISPFPSPRLTPGGCVGPASWSTRQVRCCVACTWPLKVGGGSPPGRAGRVSANGGHAMCTSREERGPVTAPAQGVLRRLPLALTPLNVSSMSLATAASRGASPRPAVWHRGTTDSMGFSYQHWAWIILKFWEKELATG